MLFVCLSVCLCLFRMRISTETAERIWLKFCTGTAVCPRYCISYFGGYRHMGPARAAEVEMCGNDFFVPIVHINEVKMTCSGEGLANVKLKWLCFPSSRVTYWTESLSHMIRWKAAMEIHSHSHSSIPIPILLFPLPFPFPWYSHCHCHYHGNPMGGNSMGSQLFPFPCTYVSRRCTLGRGRSMLCQSCIDQFVFLFLCNIFYFLLYNDQSYYVVSFKLNPLKYFNCKGVIFFSKLMKCKDSLRRKDNRDKKSRETRIKTWI